MLINAAKGTPNMIVIKNKQALGGTELIIFHTIHSRPDQILGSELTSLSWGEDSEACVISSVQTG